MKMKHVEVYEEDHRMLKVQASIKGLSLRSYLHWLAVANQPKIGDHMNKAIAEGVENERKK